MTNVKLLFTVGNYLYYDNFTTISESRTFCYMWKIQDGAIYWQSVITGLLVLDSFDVQLAYQAYLLRLITDEQEAAI